METIKRIINLGSNCIGTDWINSIKLREKSPVDNFAEFRLSSSVNLFNGKINNYILNNQYIKRKSTLEEKQKYFFRNEIFIFPEGFSIVHNDFESRKFRKEFKKRIRIFNRFCKKAKNNNSFWFIYSLSKEDENLSLEDINRLKNGLPKYVSDKLICLGIRGNNPGFKNVFKYYYAINKEEDFSWHDKDQAFSIVQYFETTYKLKFFRNKK